jgi:hypothetical protein
MGLGRRTDNGVFYTHLHGDGGRERRRGYREKGAVTQTRWIRGGVGIVFHVWLRRLLVFFAGWIARNNRVRLMMGARPEAWCS